MAVAKISSVKKNGQWLGNGTDGWAHTLKRGKGGGMVCMQLTLHRTSGMTGQVAG